MPKDELEDILREFIPHSAEYCIKDLASAVRGWMRLRIPQRMKVEKWDIPSDGSKDGYNQALSEVAKAMGVEG